MKQISAELGAHLASSVTTICTCWKLTRRDNTVYGFTDLDKDITISGIVYKATAGFSPTAISSNYALAVDNMDVEGVLNAENIAESDLLAGKYDFAEVEIFKVNYEDLTQGKLPLRRGWLGEVAVKNGKFVAEIRGLTDRLTASIGEYYSPSCRAQFGDSRCKKNLAAYTFSGSITLVTDRQIFIDSSRSEAAGFFNQGKVTFISGLNAGISMEVKEFSAGGKITLVLPLPFSVIAGDSYTMSAGCDKTFQTCVGLYNNALNFRGEPHVPGTDKILETAGTSNR